MIDSILRQAQTAGISWPNIHQNNCFRAIKATIMTCRHNRPALHKRKRESAINGKKSAESLSTSNGKATVHKRESTAGRHEALPFSERHIAGGAAGTATVAVG